MAQADIFNNFISGIKNTTAETQRMSEDLMRGQNNIYKVKQDLLKSDIESLNVFKRSLNVGNKILNQLKVNKKYQEEISRTKTQINDLENQILKANKEKNAQLRDALIIQRNSLRLKHEYEKVQISQMRKSIPLLGKLGEKGTFLLDSMLGVGNALGGVFKLIGTVVSGLFTIGKTIFKMILSPLKKAFKVFTEIQSTVGNLAADIGLTSQESMGLLNNFASLSLSAMKFGGSMKDVATIFKTFSETTNKNRFFTEREIGQLTELGLGTSLGVDGASELASSFNNIGISLEKTIKLTDKARNLAAKYNINTTKVLKTYQGLVTSLTGIGFGRGLTNLTKLAAKATAIRFDIVQSTKAFTDSFSDLDKSVEASAQMQALGGKFAENFGDPIKLAFESMNEPEKLAERVTDLVTGSIIKSGDSFIIPPAERKMLRIAAESLGQDYEQMQNAAIEQAKMADKISAVSKAGFSLTNFTEEEKLALSGLMDMNKDGKYTIQLPDGTVKLLSNVTNKDQLKNIIDERKKNENAAIQRKNVMERLSLIVDRFMTGFSTVFNKLFANGNFESFLQMVEKAGTKISQFIMDDLIGTNGIGEGFKTLVDRAKEVFKQIEGIFSGDGTLVQKIGSALGLVFKDIAIPLVSSILSGVMPMFKTAIGTLLEAIGRALPKKFGGEKMMQSGLRMQKEGIENSPTLQKMYGKTGIDSLNEQIKPNTGSGSGIQGAGLYAKSAYQGINAIKGSSQLFGGTLGKNAARMVNVGAKRGGKWGLKALGMAVKRIPILGALASAGFAVNDLLEGDYTGAFLNATSGLANLGNLFLPGVGSAVSAGIDAGNAMREMGAFDDGVIYKDGSYAKFGKGDMVQFIDQAAMERAGTGSSGGGSSNSVQHSGTITIKSDDGKVVTWEQMYGARDLIGSQMESIKKSYDGGFGNFSNSNITPIRPLL